MGKEPAWTREEEAEFNGLSFAIAAAVVLEDRQPADAVRRRWHSLYRRWAETHSHLE